MPLETAGCALPRRRWIGQTIALLSGAACQPTFAALSAAQRNRPSASRGDRPPLSADEWLIRNATVVTTSEDGTGLLRADIHVRRGIIARIGPELNVPSAARLDAEGRIAMPGLIDRHWHMWNSLARGAAPQTGDPDNPGNARFFQMLLQLSPHFRKQDNALAIRFAAAEAIDGGITSVTNWAHNIRGPAWADAEIEALFDSGLSGRFLYGYPQDMQAAQTMDTDDVLRVQRAYFSGSAPAFDLGIAMRGPERTPASVWRNEGTFALQNQLPFSMHIGVSADLQRKRGIQMLAKAGLLGNRTELVHATHADDEDFAAIVQAGSQVVVTPLTEMRVGYGVTPIARMLKAGITPGLGIDTTVLSGDANLFNVARVAAFLADGQAEDEQFVRPAQALRWLTADAAASLGRGATLGTLVAGKQADIVLIDPDALNVAPVTDTVALLSAAITPANVHSVMAKGRLLKYDGRLTYCDVPTLIEQVNAAWSRLRKSRAS